MCALFPTPHHTAAMQWDIQRRIMIKTSRMFRILTSAGIASSAKTSLQLLIGDAPDDQLRPDSRLDAARCDLLDHSGRVDPLPALDSDVRDVLQSCDLLFCDAPVGVESFVTVFGDPRKIFIYM